MEERSILAQAINGQQAGSGYDAVLYDDALLVVTHLADGVKGYAFVVDDLDDLDDPTTIVVEAANLPGEWVEMWETDDGFDRSRYGLA